MLKGLFTIIITLNLLSLNASQDKLGEELPSQRNASSSPEPRRPYPAQKRARDLERSLAQSRETYDYRIDVATTMKRGYKCLDEIRYDADLFLKIIAESDSNVSNLTQENKACVLSWVDRLLNIKRSDVTNPNAVVSADGNTRLHYALNTLNEADLVLVWRLLITVGASASLKNANGMTPFMLAVCYNKCPFLLFDVYTLIEEHARIKNNDDETILHLAVSNKNYRLLELIIKNFTSYDINAQDRLGNTPLHRALKDQTTNIIRLLSQHPMINRSLKNLSGETIQDIAEQNAREHEHNAHLVQNKKSSYCWQS